MLYTYTYRFLRLHHSMTTYYISTTTTYTYRYINTERKSSPNFHFSHTLLVTTNIEDGYDGSLSPLCPKLATLDSNHLSTNFSFNRSIFYPWPNLISGSSPLIRTQRAQVTSDRLAPSLPLFPWIAFPP